jgi:hypothetical protein
MWIITMAETSRTSSLPEMTGKLMSLLILVSHSEPY